MRTIQKVVFKLDELDKEKQEKAIDKHREINVDYDWWGDSLDFVVEDIKDKLGVELDSKDLYFDVCSKCCGLWIDRDNLIRALSKKHNDLMDIDLNENFGVFAYHSIKCSDIGYISLEDEDEDDNEFKEIVRKKTEQERAEQKKDNIENDLYTILEIFEKAFKGLYDDYYYRLSDEGVKETLEINDYEFDEDGGIV